MDNLTFYDLEPNMRVFDFEEEVFGTIVEKQDQDPDWLLIEVLWDNDDVEERSYVLSGKQVGVVLEAGSARLERYVKEFGEELEELQCDLDEDFSVVQIVDVW